MKQVKTPTLIIDKEICRNNILKMIEKAQSAGCGFRPHFKTHQSVEIGEMFKDFGVTKIAVSSVSMAKFFFLNGWQDILIAFPANPLEIDEINQLSNSCNLILLINSEEILNFFCDKFSKKVRFMIEVDCGYSRSGISFNRFEEIERIISLAENTNLEFHGFLVHAGNNYKCRGQEEIREAAFETLGKIKIVKDYFRKKYPGLIVSYGDTPSCSVLNIFGEADELRPGNFVFYDLMQVHIGSCNFKDVAVALACPVVEVNSEREEVVIYGGAVHLSKEGLIRNDVEISYGEIILMDGLKWRNPVKGAYVKSLSQEHGVIHFPESRKYNIKPGMLLGIIPVHSCLTMSTVKQAWFSDGTNVTVME